MKTIIIDEFTFEVDTQEICGEDTHILEKVFYNGVEEKQMFSEIEQEIVRENLIDTIFRYDELLGLLERHENDACDDYNTSDDLGILWMFLTGWRIVLEDNNK